ncbi:glycosyltransferase family 47 protein [Gonapodya prolifera JEL478]|uniref:Glycosyltransferase family 47 protein n=1 Tax=Gonapodya prolifera (strain JEL478) TaxID=1344416 RepID=A0A139ACZ5_GONPJ|nr:glycosyltransferase family 47 protein [Gonapodya prolifera JEL478]|eukprot:KXS14696.1 glycosyltransferase family 47 protein [Gonapodya prolifera JEL478]
MKRHPEARHRKLFSQRSHFLMEFGVCYFQSRNLGGVSQRCYELKHRPASLQRTWLEPLPSAYVPLDRFSVLLNIFNVHLSRKILKQVCGPAIAGSMNCDLLDSYDDPTETEQLWHRREDNPLSLAGRSSAASPALRKSPSEISFDVPEREIGKPTPGIEWLVIAAMSLFVAACAAIVGNVRTLSESSKLALESTSSNPSDQFIYVYSIPPHLLLPNISCGVNSMYAVEVLFPKLVLSSPHHSPSPSSATYFLVPHYTTCMYHQCIFSLHLTPDECKSRASSYLAAILDDIQNTHPFWKRSGGTDHILVFSWDQASEILGWTFPVRARVLPAVHLTLLGTTTLHPNFSPHKDIVIPPYANYTLPLFLTYRPPSQRHILAHFRGTIHKDLAYSLGVRQRLVDLSKRHPHLFHVHEGHSTGHWSELSDSVFALCPGGWSPWSPRLFDSLVAGSIPVIFADDIQLPFEDIVDYHKVAFRLGNDDVDALRPLLEAVSPEMRRTMWDEGREVRRRFVWNDPPQEDDAFETTVQVLRTKRARPYFGRPRLDCSAASCSDA